MFRGTTLDTTLSVLSAMITPAVMILATSSLILTTTNRLVRVIDRVREMVKDFEEIARAERPEETKRNMMFDQLDRATVRARLIQRALTFLYLALGFFITTSVVLGVISFAHINAGWLPLVLGLVGAFLLLNASILLILESRISLAATYMELDYIRQISHVHAPPELRERPRWRIFR
jgi:hypothetical protein